MGTVRRLPQTQQVSDWRRNTIRRLMSDHLPASSRSRDEKMSREAVTYKLTAFMVRGDGSSVQRGPNDWQDERTNDDGSGTGFRRRKCRPINGAACRATSARSPCLQRALLSLSPSTAKDARGDPAGLSSWSRSPSATAAGAMSYPRAEPASPEYAYCDPKTAPYDMGRLPSEFHPLDAWKRLGREPESIGQTIFTTFVVAALTIGTQAYVNHWNRRPWYAQGLRTALMLATTLTGFRMYRTHVAAADVRRDAIIQHYLETHYDDFDMIKRRKIKDMIIPWLPIRP